MGKLYVVHNECIKGSEIEKMSYKIGITKSTIKARYYGLGLKMPGKFVCDFAYEFDDEERHAKLEKIIHGLLDLQRINGEWYYCNDKMLYAIEEICEDFDGKLILDEIEKEIFDATEEKKKDDTVFLQVQEEVKKICADLTKKNPFLFQRRIDNKLFVVRMKNKFGARLECNIYHPSNKRVDLELICRNSPKFPEIKDFIESLDGVKINNYQFNFCKSVTKIFHTFNYNNNDKILKTFLELQKFVLEKMKNSKIFKE
jgi:hypothetical protein